MQHQIIGIKQPGMGYCFHKIINETVSVKKCKPSNVSYAMITFEHENDEVMLSFDYSCCTFSCKKVRSNCDSGIFDFRKYV